MCFYLLLLAFKNEVIMSNSGLKSKKINFSGTKNVDKAWRALVCQWNHFEESSNSRTETIQVGYQSNLITYLTLFLSHFLNSMSNKPSDDGYPASWTCGCVVYYRWISESPLTISFLQTLRRKMKSTPRGEEVPAPRKVQSSVCWISWQSHLSRNEKKSTKKNSWFISLLFSSI
jgi:hypothetical protein